MEVSNLTRDFLQKMMQEGKRFDGRGLLETNNLTIEYEVSNKAEGSARVKLGKTEVIAGIKMSPGDPYPDSLDKGNLIVSGDLLPLASPRFEMGPPGFAGIEMPRLVDRIIRESKIIDLKKLIIGDGKKVWNVFIDIYPINDDGSLIDAASIACVAALHNATIPILDENGRVDFEKKGKEKIPLAKGILPISITFYKLGNSILIHPTREEEEACDAKITFGASMFGDKLMLNSCQKGWPTTLSSEEINKMMDEIGKIYEDLSKKLIKHLN